MTTLMKNWLWRIPVGLILLVVVLAVVRAVSERGDTGGISFRTAAVTRADVIQSVTANGELAAVKTVQVGCQVSGMIKELLVDYNSVVTNGQVIARLDPATFEQNLAQADAELATAKAALELAEVNFRRAEALHREKLIADSEFDKTQAELSQSRANVKMREASLNRARVDLERTTITAPIDGVVITRTVNVGQTVAANFNTPTLFLIANDLRKMRIETKVSEADVGGVKPGQPVTFTVDAFPDRTFTGQVTMVRYAATMEQNVVNYTTLVEVNNDDLELRPTMTANATIITRQSRNVLRVPNAALRFTPPAGAWLASDTNASTAAEATGARTVYLAKQRDENGRVRTQLETVSVKTGITDGSFTEILVGLGEGQLVVTAALTTSASKQSASKGSVFLTGGGGGGGPPR
jgi:HlyD family secretion protein